jgi:protein arginine kinase
MRLDTLTNSIGEWLRGTGPDSDIVMSSRVRLARNLAQFPFVSRATEQDRAETERVLRERIVAVPVGQELDYIDVGHLEEIDRRFLVERQLISREHADAQGARGVAIDRLEQVSLMINEEDHLRIQCIHSGLDLRGVWEQIKVVDEQIGQVVPYAFHPRFGYLTACPTNVGTGIRVSVMLHLPALVITRQIDKVCRSLHKISLAVRGLYGEGSQAMGDFYQISNQTTLGKSEEELVEQVGDVVPVLIDYERRAREFLVRETQQNVHDQVSRAYGILRTAQTITAEETMQLLSRVRMGVLLGLIGDPTGLRVLDLACGEGFYTRLLRQRGAARVLGVDLSARMIELAREQESAHGLGVQYQVADARAVELEGECDLVVAAYLLNYARDAAELQEMYEAIARYLTPGGRFVTVNTNPALDFSAAPSYQRYGFEATLSGPPRNGPPRNGAPLTWTFHLPDASVSVENYCLDTDTHETAMRAAGLRDIRWHGLRVSPEGRSAMAPDAWDVLLAHPPVTLMECRR